MAQCLKTLVCSVWRLTQTDLYFLFVVSPLVLFYGHMSLSFVRASLWFLVKNTAGQQCHHYRGSWKKKKDCWTVQLSLLIWKLQENICELSTSPTTECGTLSTEPPFGPSLLHAFIPLVSSEISQTRANKYNSHNSHLPPVISLPHPLLLFMYLIFLERSAVSQIVLNSAAHP